MTLSSHLIAWLIGLPLFGAVAVALLPRHRDCAARWTTLIVSAVVLGLAAAAVGRFDVPAGNLGWEDGPHRAFPLLPAHYHVGMDAFSLWLVALTAFLTPLVVLGSWTQVTTGVRGFHVCVLLLESALIGTFCARDLALFYVFWEAVLIPMYFLIGIWGGRRRGYAMLKFVLYTAVGSLAMLVGILWLAHGPEGWDFSLASLSERALPLTTQRWLFWAFTIAFLIKVPLFPLHTWLPDAHVEAPTGGSVFLAGVLLKMGVYGMARIAIPLFPLAFQEASPILIALASIGAVYGALMAIAQRDLKALVAYSSVSHLAIILLGLFSRNESGVAGALMQTINHGLSTGALFFVVGMLYERTHSRDLEEHAGLAARVPLLAAALFVSSLASLGFPGLNGFVGELLILKGVVAAPGAALSGTMRYLPAIATAFTLILSAVYLLWGFQRMFFGTYRSPVAGLGDLNAREGAVIAALVAPMVLMGLFPAFWLNMLKGNALQLLQQGWR